MFIRNLFLILSLVLSLYAVPDIEELKAMVQNNPELLNTPEAQAEMHKRGITDEDLQKKINKLKNSNDEEITLSNKLLNNDIDYLDNNESNESNKSVITQEMIDLEDEELSKRLNPFTFTTNNELRRELNKKHTVLIKNKLTRYSMKFYTNKNMIDSSSMPTPDDYILSTGDELNIYIYGDRDKVYNLMISNNGTIEVPFIGPIKVGGMKYIKAQEHLQNRLQNHFKRSDFNIKIGKYSTIQVTLVGDVSHPGLYNISSFSTVKDLLIASRGTNKTASVREILIKRNGKIISKLDFYDLLFHGKNFGNILLRHGDIVIIQQAKKLISIDGNVNNSAIFELTENENLHNLLVYAGGMRPNASKLNIKIDRFSDNLKIETFNIALKDARDFKMRNGDAVYIHSLDDSDRDNVNIYGNIIRPGSYPIGADATLNQLLKNSIKYGAKKFFLPQTYFEYGVIKRYAKSLKYETKSFNITKVLNGSQKIKLLPEDEIYIFNQNDIFSSKYITTKGDILLNPGKLQYFSGMTLCDAVNASGIDSRTEDSVRVTTFNTDNLMPKTTFYSLKTQGNTKLSPYDEIEVLDYYDTHVLTPVSISGEILNPSIVYYEKGMSVQNLIDIAGGLTPKAYSSNIEIVRYFVDETETRERTVLRIDTKKLHYSDIKLQPYDEVIIFKIPKWNASRVVELKGEVRFPGKYTVKAGEKLSSVLKRAGGFTDEAFIEGTVFTRESIRVKQVEQYNRSLAKIKRQLAIYNAMPANARKSGPASTSTDKLNEVMLEAKKYQPVGRISIKLSGDLDKLDKSEYNLVLQDKDTITVPGYIDTVSIFGEVFNPTSFVFRNNMDTQDYIELASGYTRAADDSRTYIIHADGTSEPAVSGWWIFSSNVDVKSGDTLVIPIYIQEYNQLELWDSITKIMASFAITAATLNTLGVL